MRHHILILVIIFVLVSLPLSALSEKPVIQNSGPKPEWVRTLSFPDNDQGYYFVGLGEDENLNLALEKARGSAFKSLLQFLDYQVESNYSLVREGNVVTVTENLKGYSSLTTLSGIKEQDLFWEKIKEPEKNIFHAYVLIPLTKIKIAHIKKMWNEETEMILKEFQTTAWKKNYNSLTSLGLLKDRLTRLPKEFQGTKYHLIESIDQKIKEIKSVSVSFQFKAIPKEQYEELKSLLTAPLTEGHYQLTSDGTGLFQIKVNIRSSLIDQTVYKGLEDLVHVLNVVTIKLFADGKLIREAVFEAHGFGLDGMAANREAIEKMTKKIKETFSPYFI